jgi:hypothetical protein
MRDNYFSEYPVAIGHGHFWRSEITGMEAENQARAMINSDNHISWSLSRKKKGLRSCVHFPGHLESGGFGCVTDIRRASWNDIAVPSGGLRLGWACQAG